MAVTMIVFTSSGLQNSSTHLIMEPDNNWKEPTETVELKFSHSVAIT